MKRTALSPRELIILSESLLTHGLRGVRHSLERDQRALAAQVAAPAALSIVGGLESFTLSDEAEEAAAPAAVIGEGGNALEKLERHGEAAKLSDAESSSLEAIVKLIGRPAILIQDGAFFPPPADWRESLEAKRAGIEQTFLGVGRIEVKGHPDLEWIGTGFLIGEDVIMTNRHVAREFTETVDGKPKIVDGMEASIDFKEEFGGMAGAEFEITEVLGIHSGLDMAVFRVSGTNAGGVQFPKPLQIARKPPVKDLTDRNVYVVGYPAWDGRRNDPEPMSRIFSNIFNVKRLQPGKATGVAEERNVLTHDCSTLGGNSGSSLFDLETQQVLGLHFGGRFRQANQAVALWTLQEDPLLRDLNLNWT